MRQIDLNPRAPMVTERREPTTETLIVLQQIAAMLRELEARIEALEP